MWRNVSFFFNGGINISWKRFKIAYAGVCVFSFTCKCIFEKGASGWSLLTRMAFTGGGMSHGILLPVNTAISFKILFSALVWMLPPDAQVRHSLENESGATCWGWNSTGASSRGIRYLHSVRKSRGDFCGTDEN